MGLGTRATTSRIDGLDTLRSAAIILVFMYHYMAFVSHSPTFGWGSTVGWVGVDLFFVLSGYLIANQIFSGIAAGRQLSLKTFYVRRLLRTLPNYYVVLAAYFLLPDAMGGSQPPPLWTFLTFTQNYMLRTGTAFSHAWSLCIEEQFYLALPFVVVLGLRFRWSIRHGWGLLTILMALGIATRSALWFHYGRIADGGSSGYFSHIYYSSFCRFDEFLPGVAVAMLKNFHRGAWDRVRRWGHITLAGGTLGIAVVFYLLLHDFWIDGYGYGFFMTACGYSLLAIGFAVLTIAALSPGSMLHRVRVPGAANVAAWSYAIYLSHKAVAVIVQRQLGRSSVDIGAGGAVVIISAACLLSGWLLHAVVETPFMKFRERHYPTSFPIVAFTPAEPTLSERQR